MNARFISYPSLRYDVYATLGELVNQAAEEIKPTLEQIQDIYQTIPGNSEFSSRIKDPYSLFGKLLRTKTNRIYMVTDFVGVRAILDDKEQCYEYVSKIIDAGWNPYGKIYHNFSEENVYTSLDFCFYNGNQVWSLQTRTPRQERLLNNPNTHLHHGAYKSRELHRYFQERDPKEEKVRINDISCLFDNYDPTKTYTENLILMSGKDLHRGREFFESPPIHIGESLPEPLDKVKILRQIPL